MSFWENVEYLLEQKGMLKKELAIEVGINPSNFGKGKLRNSIPAADTAIKIAHCLDVSLEYLLGMESSPDTKISESRNAELVKKYYPCIKNLNSLPVEIRETFIKLLDLTAEKYRM